jgi:hypothetical protein
MARRHRRAHQPPQVHPFDVDGVRTVAVGTVLWAAAFVLLALNRASLDEQGLGWWLWTCLAGVGLGLLGLEYTRKRRDAIAQALLDEEANRPDEPADWPAADQLDEPADWPAAELPPVEVGEPDEPVPLPVEQTGERPPGVRRARRDARAAADEAGDGGTTYRGRRARRHG